MMFPTLIGADELQRQLHAPNWIIVDCRFDLADPGAGERAYTSGHIPGAWYAHLDRDLAAPVTATSGRHPLPSPESLSATFSRWGIDANVQVVAYDQDSGAFAARLWWLLRWLGHDAVAVLDGGFAAWSQHGYEVDTQPARVAPRNFAARVRADFFVTTDAVGAMCQDPSARVLDARAPERYAGQVEPIDAVAGHIPGARNQPFTDNLDADKRFRAIPELRQHLTRALGSIAPERAVAMCGSGVTACHLLLAMEHAGLAGAKLYAGSWSEWIRDPLRPVATGRNSG